ncbi:MAG: hypothetical protein P4N41_20500 [Negativicutes bacterium]|nr:hypothetical protein [Negativicutes bacterium]
MDANKVINLLRNKLKLLDEIKVNTEKQARFARRGEMRGLRRLLNERAALIDKLLKLDREMTAGAHSPAGQPDLKKLTEAIAARKLEILACWDTALQEAMAARDRVGTRLFDVRTGRRLQHQYVNCWTIPIQGSRFNKRG